MRSAGDVASLRWARIPAVNTGLSIFVFFYKVIPV
jgi:hypothetical protein